MIKTGYENIVGRPGILPYEPHEIDRHPDERLKATIERINRIMNDEVDTAREEGYTDGINQYSSEF